MKYQYLLLAVFLAGCGGVHTNLAQQQINQAGNKELAAWEKVRTDAYRTCPQGTNNQPLARSKALDAYNCRVAYIENYVRPVAYSPLDLNRLILDQKKTTIHYKNGKIDRDEANLQLDEAFNAYVVRIDQKSKNELVQAYQQDRALSQQLGQASQQIGAMEAQNQQTLRDSRPVNTNCRYIGNQMNCTSW